MNTLFITDLDGTLLNPDAHITLKSLQILNSLLAEGMLLTCATARSASTALPILSGLDLCLPVILMNGSAVYDGQKQRYESEKAIEPEAAGRILDFLSAADCPAFVYSIKDDQLLCFSPPRLNEAMKHFRQYRQRFYGKKFTDIASYDVLRRERIIYFTFVGSRHELLPVYDHLRNEEGFSALFYQDVYGAGWCLELSRKDVTKGSAALRLKETCDAENLCVFGDNLNDLPLFAAADYCIAPANAKPALLEKADLIIPDNRQDSVAYCLRDIWKRGYIDDGYF